MASEQRISPQAQVPASFGAGLPPVPPPLPPPRKSRVGLYVGLAVTGGVVLFVLVGIGLTLAMSRAKGLAQRVMSMSNLREISRACLAYSQENDGRWPDNLAVLVEKGLLPAECLFSFGTGRPPRLDRDGKPVPPFDYVYVYLGSKHPMFLDKPEEAVLAYERPENYKGEGTNVLFADTHVEWVSMEEFARRLARSEQLLKEQEAP